MKNYIFVHVYLLFLAQKLKTDTMKRIVIFITVLLMAQLSMAQLFSWGVKAGVNSTKVSFDDFSIKGDPQFTIDYNYLATHPDAVTYDGDGNITYIDPAAFDVTLPGVQFKPKSYEMGYHFGAFVRLKVLGIYVQPELIFSHAEASIDFSETDELAGALKTSTASIKYNNFDIPVMVGMKLGPARFNLGPVASFKLSPNVEGAEAEVKESLNSFTKATEFATFGGQVGVGIDILKKLTLDVRYEFPLSKLGDQVNIGENTFKTDQRQTQFIASVGWFF